MTFGFYLICLVVAINGIHSMGFLSVLLARQRATSVDGHVFFILPKTKKKKKKEKAVEFQQPSEPMRNCFIVIASISPEVNKHCWPDGLEF